MLVKLYKVITYNANGTICHFVGDYIKTVRVCKHKKKVYEKIGLATSITNN